MMRAVLVLGLCLLASASVAQPFSGQSQSTAIAAAVAVETTRATTAEGLLLPKAGVTDGSNAAAGQIGEYLTVTGSITPISTATPINLATLSLTAGDWDVWGSVEFDANGATVWSLVSAWVSPAGTPALPSYPNGGAFYLDQYTSQSGAFVVVPTGTTRISISSTTSYFVAARGDFATTSPSAQGFLAARRVR